MSGQNETGDNGKNSNGDALSSASAVNAIDKKEGPTSKREKVACNSQDDSPKFLRIPVDRWIELGFTAAILIATAVNVIVATEQWSAMMESNEINRRVFSAVERPIIVANVTNISASFESLIGRPNFTIQLQNIGKQVAYINTIYSRLVIQTETLAPLITTKFKNDGTHCTIYLLGLLVLKPNDSKDLSCHRQAVISAEDATAVQNRAKYAFFSVVALYTDSVDSDRYSGWMFLYRPTGQLGHIIPVEYEEQLNKDRKPEQTTNIQRELLNTFLQIERERGSPFPEQ